MTIISHNFIFLTFIDIDLNFVTFKLPFILIVLICNLQLSNQSPLTSNKNNLYGTDNIHSMILKQSLF